MSSFFLHEQGLCESSDVGEGTRIWAFAHVGEGARVGADCNVCDHVFVEGGAQIHDGRRTIAPPPEATATR